MNIPKCVGVIMDGNRRWARAHNLPLLEGHRAGGEKLKEVVRWAKDAGVEHIIFFTFSTENWKRTPEEVSYLLALIGEYVRTELAHFSQEGGILHCVGDLSRFPEHVQRALIDAETSTAANQGPHVYLALNYGGRSEIVAAVKKMIAAHPQPEEITEAYVAQHLYTSPMPDPDMIIRTSGERRLSGFLPWQGVYSELFFTDTLWPDFSKEEFSAMLEEYAERDRRRGA